VGHGDLPALSLQQKNKPHKSHAFWARSSSLFTTVHEWILIKSLYELQRWFLNFSLKNK
jgi:hypothetical protein